MKTGSFPVKFFSFSQYKMKTGSKFFSFSQYQIKTGSFPVKFFSFSPFPKKYETKKSPIRGAVLRDEMEAAI
jgi:hypothetical protein